MALKKLDVSGRDTLVIYRQGPVGLSATLLGRAMMGARVIAVDVTPARLEHARRLGADETLNPAEGDCTGNAGARAQTVRSARVWSRVLRW